MTSHSWLDRLNTTLDNLENAARAKVGGPEALAAATQTLDALETGLQSLSAEERAQLQKGLTGILTRITTVTGTLEHERNATGAELSALRTRARALRSYSQK